MRPGRSEVSGHYDHAFNVICNSVIRSVTPSRNEMIAQAITLPPEAGITTKPRK